MLAFSSFFRRRILRIGTTTTSRSSTSNSSSKIKTTIGTAAKVVTTLTLLCASLSTGHAFTFPVSSLHAVVGVVVSSHTPSSIVPVTASVASFASSSSSSSLGMTAAASMPPLPPPPLSSQEIPSWQDLQQRLSSTTVVGQALDADLQLRHAGKGSPHVHNHLRLFDDGTNDETKDNHNKNKTPKYTLYRDHAGWCPYCQKTMLLIEAKEIPIAIELINMRSYGDKPQQFLRKVPNGLLPAIENNDSGEIILDSAYIMEFLDQEYSTNSNNNNAGSSSKQMIPDRATQPTQYQRYEQLLTLERELFSWWCTFMFRAEQPPSGGSSGSGSTNLLQNLFGGGSTANTDNTDIDNSKYVSPTQNGFLNCLATVNTALTATDGPFFLDYATPSHPTMIDFIYASHIERMFASAAYWKGMNLRSSQDYPKLRAIQDWMNALEKNEYYLAFKSDYYTHVKDIPPQYGPSSTGFNSRQIQHYQADIEGKGSAKGGATSNSWKLPLDDDDALQPLFNGIPLPIPVLDAMDIQSDTDGSYTSSSSTREMKLACQLMAVWKVCQNGPAIAKFACRGGPNGSNNIRKTFGAELADPYAKSDDAMIATVDTVLRVVASVMMNVSNDGNNNTDDDDKSASSQLPPPNTLPGPEYAALLQDAVKKTNGDVAGVIKSLEYFRDRIGVPRDLPLASARYLRAYLNWSIDVLLASS